ncbi:MAG: hypothetical protein WC728_04950 [Elusimicrobiota bacterium]
MNLILALAVSWTLAAPQPKVKKEEPKPKGPVACLEEHEEELSEPCSAFLEEREEKQDKALARLQKVCAKEIEASCKDAAALPEIRKCLLAADKLEGRCGKWAERAKNRQPKAGEKKPKGPNKLQEACKTDIEKLCPKKGKKAKQDKP